MKHTSIFHFRAFGMTVHRPRSPQNQQEPFTENGTDKVMRQFVKNENGTALVEFAIVLPFLLLILYGVISWGYTLALTDAMYDAAREGAREMSVGESDEATASSTVRQRLGSWSGPFDILAQDTLTTGTDRVVVTVTSDNVFDGLLPFIGSLPPLVAQVTMRKES